MNESSSNNGNSFCVCCSSSKNESDKESEEVIENSGDVYDMEKEGVKKEKEILGLKGKTALKFRAKNKESGENMNIICYYPSYDIGERKSSEETEKSGGEIINQKLSQNLELKSSELNQILSNYILNRDKNTRTKTVRDLLQENIHLSAGSKFLQNKKPSKSNVLLSSSTTPRKENTFSQTQDNIYNYKRIKRSFNINETSKEDKEKHNSETKQYNNLFNTENVNNFNVSFPIDQRINYRLNNYYEISKIKGNQLRKKIEDKFEKECTFTPNIIKTNKSFNYKTHNSEENCTEFRRSLNQFLADQNAYKENIEQKIKKLKEEKKTKELEEVKMFENNITKRINEKLIRHKKERESKNSKMHQIILLSRATYLPFVLRAAENNNK